MVQEIIVYIILIATALRLLQQIIVLVKPASNLKNQASCSGGSCSNCSLKFDLDSIQTAAHLPKSTKNSFIEYKGSVNKF